MKNGTFRLLSVFAIPTMRTQASIDTDPRGTHEDVSKPANLTWYRWKDGIQ